MAKLVKIIEWLEASLLAVVIAVFTLIYRMKGNQLTVGSWQSATISRFGSKPKSESEQKPRTAYCFLATADFLWKRQYI